MNGIDHTQFAMSEDEIAARLGIGRGSVNKHLASAARKIRREFGDEWPAWMELLRLAREGKARA